MLAKIYTKHVRHLKKMRILINLTEGKVLLINVALLAILQQSQIKI